MHPATLDPPVRWSWQIGAFVLDTQWNSSAQVQSGTRPDVQNDPLVQNTPLDELDDELLLDELLEPDELLELLLDDEPLLELDELLELDDELLDEELDELLEPDDEEVLEITGMQFAIRTSPVRWSWQIGSSVLGAQWNSSLGAQSGVNPEQQ